MFDIYYLKKLLIADVSKKFIWEIGKFDKNLTTMVSTFEPNYVFVGKSLYSNLYSLYGDLIRNFKVEDIIIMHKGSATAKKVLKLCKWIREKEKFSSITTIGAYNDADYLREDFILDKLIEHIKYNFKEGSSHSFTSYYSSMISILQSSGYGKSKIMGKLGSIMPTFSPPCNKVLVFQRYLFYYRS